MLNSFDIDADFSQARDFLNDPDSEAGDLIDSLFDGFWSDMESEEDNWEEDWDEDWSDMDMDDLEDLIDDAEDLIDEID